jgi:Catalytic LigB subunit of aromatic ring-opening dioxygenase
MATIVAACMTSHAPNMTATPEAAPAQRKRFLAGLEEMRRRLIAARPDLVVMFVNDHVQNFFYDNLPAYCVGVGDKHWAPRCAAGFLKIPERQVPGAPDWSKSLLATGLEAGFDLAVSHDLEFWDDVSVPAHFLMPEGTLPIVPVLTNCVAPPLPTPKRSWALGSFVRRFIAGRPASERIALIATGGISHWIGVPNTGHINPEWDRWVLDTIADGRGEELAALSWSQIERDGGNGGQEIRNWIAVLGAVPGVKGEVLTYEPVKEWLTGCGAVWMQV